jgi:hypothetical protein
MRARGAGRVFVWVLVAGVLVAPTAAGHVSESVGHNWKHYYKKAIASFYTKAESDAKYLEPNDGDARYVLKATGTIGETPNHELFIKRINSTSSTAGNVVAAIDSFWRIERDGTNGGWRLAWPDADVTHSINISCMHAFTGGTDGAKVSDFARGAGSPAGTTILYSDADGIRRFDCMFGDPEVGQHSTTLNVHRSSGDNWVGELITTWDQ